MTVEEHRVSTTGLLEVSPEDRYGSKADIGLAYDDGPPWKLGMSNCALGRDIGVRPK
jgi:hypothetical protein